MRCTGITVYLVGFSSPNDIGENYEPLYLGFKTASLKIQQYQYVHSSRPKLLFLLRTRKNPRKWCFSGNRTSNPSGHALFSAVRGAPKTRPTSFLGQAMAGYSSGSVWWPRHQSCQQYAVDKALVAHSPRSTLYGPTVPFGLRFTASKCESNQIFVRNIYIKRNIELNLVGQCFFARHGFGVH